VTQPNLEEKFAATFGVVANAINAAPERHEIYFTLPLIDKIGVGESATAIVKCVRTQRGFGLTIHFGSGVIVGMRSLQYDTKKSPDSHGNIAFIEEMKRRLSVEGASLGAITNGPVSFRADHSRHLKSAIAAR